jgi:hypothetical protein
MYRLHALTYYMQYCLTVKQAVCVQQVLRNWDVNLYHYYSSPPGQCQLLDLLNLVSVKASTTVLHLLTHCFERHPFLSLPFDPRE